MSRRPFSRTSRKDTVFLIKKRTDPAGMNFLFPSQYPPSIQEVRQDTRGAVLMSHHDHESHPQRQSMKIARAQILVDILLCLDLLPTSRWVNLCF